MSFTRTVVSKRSGFVNPDVEGDAEAITKAKAIYGTADLGAVLGIVKSATFKDLSSKQVLTNNTVPDTVVYTGLGVEGTYEVAWKTTAAKPEPGDMLRLPGPISAGLADMLAVVDTFEVKYEEEGFRMASMTVTHHAGFTDVAALAGSDEELIGIRLSGSAVVEVTVMPQAPSGIPNN